MAEGPVSNRRFSRRMVRQITIGVSAAIAALIILIGAWYLYRDARDSAAQQVRTQLESRAQTLAAEIAAPVMQQQQQMAELAGQPQLVALFEQGDRMALDQAAQEHQAAFAGALKLRLLLPGKYDVDPVSDPPLSFASLELLRQAERDRGPVGAEVHLFGTPKAHIVLVRRVDDKAGQLLGLLHLALGMLVLEQTLVAMEPGGYLEVHQLGGSKPLVLGKAGKGAATGTPVVASVADTFWRANFWPDAQTQSAAGGGVPWGWLTGILLLLFGTGGGAFMLLKRRGGNPDREDFAASAGAPSVIFQGAVKAIMEGAHPGMDKLIPELPSHGQQAPIRPVSTGMSGPDVTMVAAKVPAAAKKPAEEKTPPEGTPRAERAKVAPKRAAVAPRPAPAAPAAPNVDEDPTPAPISPGIFRAYDIRGVVGRELTGAVVMRIGQAIGSEALARGQRGIAVGRDGRKSSPELAEALMKGLQSAGIRVIDVGMVPTPVLYFATHALEVNSGVMVTGSHNGPEYNGLKIVLGGETLAEDGIKSLYRRIENNELSTGNGTRESTDLVADYIRRIAEDIPAALGRSFKIVVDCGNGVAGAVAPQLIRALGHDVIELFCEVDGSFPNHHPDPADPKNLQTLIAWVEQGQADFGLAFDGDGDRLGLVDAAGNIIWPDRQLMLFAADVLSRNPGAPVIFDVKCSRHLAEVITASGGRPLMWRTGHSLIKAKMKELDAPLAGEMSGHIFFKERWYGFDDALYTAARLIELLMKTKQSPTEVFAGLPQGVSTPELRATLAEDAHQEFMQRLGALVQLDDAKVIDVDGYRIEFKDGWGLVRPSNTSPALVLRFEADDAAALQRIQEQFRALLLKARPDLSLPF